MRELSFFDEPAGNQGRVPHAARRGAPVTPACNINVLRVTENRSVGGSIPPLGTRLSTMMPNGVLTHSGERAE